MRGADPLTLLSLLVSGFSGADLERQARDAGVTVVLPLHRGELAAELARVLAGR